MVLFSSSSGPWPSCKSTSDLSLSHRSHGGIKMFSLWRTGLPLVSMSPGLFEIKTSLHTMTLPSNTFCVNITFLRYVVTCGVFVLGLRAPGLTPQRQPYAQFPQVLGLLGKYLLLIKLRTQRAIQMLITIATSVSF